MGSDPRIRAVVAEGVTGLQVADHGWLPHGIDGALQRGMEWVLNTPACYGLAYRRAPPRPRASLPSCYLTRAAPPARC